MVLDLEVRTALAGSKHAFILYTGRFCAARAEILEWKKMTSLVLTLPFSRLS